MFREERNSNSGDLWPSSHWLPSSLLPSQVNFQIPREHLNRCSLKILFHYDEDGKLECTPISYWSILTYHITWKLYWSHPSSKTPIMCDPNHWFSSYLDRNSWVLMEQVTLHSKIFTRKLWWFSTTLQFYHISLVHSLSHSQQLSALWTNATLPPSPFLTAHLFYPLSLLTNRGLLLLFPQSVAPRNTPCYFLIPHSPYLI